MDAIRSSIKTAQGAHRELPCAGSTILCRISLEQCRVCLQYSDGGPYYIPERRSDNKSDFRVVDLQEDVSVLIRLKKSFYDCHCRYSRTQVVSVLLVTIGVILTTLSAQSSSARSPSHTDTYIYVKGIGILTLALILSGFLGLVQDWTYSKYGRPTLTSALVGPAPWQESMFYLHFLGLPMFYPLLPDLVAQLRNMNNASPRAQWSLTIPIPTSANFMSALPLDIPPPFSLPHLPIHIFPQSKNTSFLTITQESLSSTFSQNALLLSFTMPQIFIPLVLNTVTQLLCVSGVHRLTTRVSSLTVTLVLVVRKAVSLMISVIGVPQVGLAIRGAVLRLLAVIVRALGLSARSDNERAYGIFGVDVDAVLSTVGMAFVGAGPSKRPQQVDSRMLWTGSALVLLGTVAYTIDSSRPRATVKMKNK